MLAVTYLSSFVPLGSLSHIKREYIKWICSYMNTYKQNDLENVPFQNVPFQSNGFIQNSW